MKATCNKQNELFNRSGNDPDKLDKECRCSLPEIQRHPEQLKHNYTGENKTKKNSVRPSDIHKTDDILCDALGIRGAY